METVTVSTKICRLQHCLEKTAINNLSLLNSLVFCSYVLELSGPLKGVASVPTHTSRMKQGPMKELFQNRVAQKAVESSVGFIPLIQEHLLRRLSTGMITAQVTGWL